MNEKNVLIAFLGGIGILIVLYGLQIYFDLAPKELLDSDINITESLGNLENERILTVDVGEKNVVLFSFDDGKTYQTENTYSVSENKTVKIVLKDNERRIVGRKTYTVKVVDSTGPVIVLNDVPNTIYVGSNIDLSKYATAHDSNNNNVDISINTNGFDVNKTGTYNITYTAIDKNNLKAEVTVEIRVINRQVAIKETTPTPSNTPTPSPSNTPTTTPSPSPSATSNPTPSPSSTPTPTPVEKPKVTYYRYRTKSILTYDCNYYNCDFTDYNDTKDKTYLFDKESYCCNSSECTKTMPKIDENSLCIYNYISGGSCIPAGESFVDRYSINNNTCYDKTLLFNANTLKTQCSDDEITIDGYCRKIDSYATLTCPNGYINENDNCYKLVKRTCNNHCTSETWSEWSSWSTTKVVASDYTEVQTKVE